MKLSPSTHIGFGLLAILLVYAAPYAWFRSHARIESSPLGGKVIILDQPLFQGESLSAPQHKIVETVYHPLMWMDSKLTGVAFFSPTRFIY
jgi:hypothetical protein